VNISRSSILTLGFVAFLALAALAIGSGRSSASFLAEIRSGEPTALPGQPETVRQQINRSDDDVNEVGGVLEGLTGTGLWLGNVTGTEGANWLGLRWGFVAVPQGVRVISATVEVYAPSTSWIATSWQIGGDTASQSPTFSATARPSQRALTVARVDTSDNSGWEVGWHSLGDVTAIVQELVDAPTWSLMHPLTLVVRGTGGAWARRHIASFDSSVPTSARLTVVYTKPS
jgi:hypothetical protein